MGPKDTTSKKKSTLAVKRTSVSSDEFAVIMGNSSASKRKKIQDEDEDEDEDDGFDIGAKSKKPKAKSSSQMIADLFGQKDALTAGGASSSSSSSSSSSGAAAISKTSPGGGLKKKRVTRMYQTIVYEEGEHEKAPRRILAVFVSNAYDRARWLSGDCNLEGDPDGDGLIEFPMRLLYANTRRNL